MTNYGNIGMYGKPHTEDVSEIQLTPAELEKYKAMAKEKLTFDKGYCGQKNQAEKISQHDWLRMYVAIDEMERAGEI